jgi:PBSX family phage terminase large subunit
MTQGLLTHRFAPRGVCRQLFERRDSEILLSGPAGTGKSRACLEKLHILALKYPGMRGLIVRKTATSLTSTALVTFKEHVAKEALAAGVVEWYGGSAQEAAQYRYANGSRITVGGMDRATRIMSSEYDVVYVQEAIELTLNDWEALTTRLRNGRMPYQQIISDTNPDRPTHWLRRRCVDGATVLLESRHEDNPVYFDADGKLTAAGASYISKLDALTGVRKHRLRHGQWVAAEGIIYEDFDQAVHLVDPFEIPSTWQRFWVVDFGFTNPFVLQRWAEDPDGRLFLYAEIYRTRRLVEDHAKQVLSEVTKDGVWLEPKPRTVICDHDAEDRATLEKHLGLGTTAAHKSVSDGIQAVASRLQPAKDGKPRLFVVRGARTQQDPELEESRKPTSTEEEFGGYVWDEGTGKNPKEQPLKQDDHGMDALRYLVAERDLGVRPRVRFL